MYLRIASIHAFGASDLENLKGVKAKLCNEIFSAAWFRNYIAMLSERARERERERECF